MGVGESRWPGGKSPHRPPWMRSGDEMGDVGGGGTAAPEAGPAEGGTAAGKEGGGGGAQLAKEHGGAGGRRGEMLDEDN